MREIQELIDRMLKVSSNELGHTAILKDIRKHVGPPCKFCGSNLSHTQAVALMYMASLYPVLHATIERK